MKETFNQPNNFNQGHKFQFLYGFLYGYNRKLICVIVCEVYNILSVKYLPSSVNI